MEKFKNKKIHVAVTLGAVFVGILLFQGAVPKEAREPKIVSLVPSEGPVGTTVTIIGSGFTTSFAGISGTKVKESVLAPGNYVLIKNEVISQPLISTDGTTLTFQIDLISSKLIKECEEKFSKKKPEPCKVHIKVVNAYGKPSNEFPYLITNNPPLLPLHASYEAIPLDPANPTQNVTLRISDTQRAEITGEMTEVYRYKLTADSHNDVPLNVSAIVQWMRSFSQPVDCLRIFDISNVYLFDALTNSQIGASSVMDPNNGLIPPGLCSLMGGAILSLAPGEQKIISVRAAASPNAPAGLQFDLVSSNSLTAPDPYTSYATGYLGRDVLISNSTGVDWLGGGGGLAHITIVP